MFDKFKKQEGGEMVEEKPEEETKVESTEEETNGGIFIFRKIK